MQITCANCTKRFQLPPEKIPARRFSFTCPKCGNQIKVDPVGTEQLKISELRPPAPSGPVEITLDPAQSLGHPPALDVAPTSSPAEQGSQGLPISAIEPSTGFAPGLPLRTADRALLATLSTTALVVRLDGPANPDIIQGLRKVGMEDVQEYVDLEQAIESLQTVEAGILFVSTTKAPPPPCEPLELVHRLSPEIRRSIFVALMADNVSSLNGQVAFLLQVNCLLSSQDLPRMPQLLTRALLHHLRLYRHWDIDADH